LDSAMGSRCRARCRGALATPTLEFKISFVRGMSETSGVIRTEGRVLTPAAGVRYRRGAHHRAKDRCLRMRRRKCLCSNFQMGSG